MLASLVPCAPSAKPSPSTSVPFPWLDVRLSHFQHLGWRLLEEEDQNGEVVDYNDSFDPEDPFRREYSTPSHHFRRWMYGGLLMVSKDMSSWWPR